MNYQILKHIIFFISCIIYVLALLADFKVFLADEAIIFGAFIFCYIVFGYNILRLAILGLLKREYFNENTLMAIASLAAFAIAEGAEAVGILLFYRLGEFLQEFIVTKTKKKIHSLKELKVESARVINSENSVILTPPDLVKVGDVLEIYAGERILCDGVALNSTSADYSAFSGEVLPVQINEGKEVQSGGINVGGVLQIKVTKLFRDSAFSKVLNLVAEGALQKAKSEEFITKFARFYTPIVTLLAFGVAIIPPLVLNYFGVSFLESLQTWAYRGIIFLVVSCPCALVLSIPLTFFVSLGSASKRGILIKGSHFLESLNNIGTIAFDKTGTLTKGILSIKDIKGFNGHSSEFILSLASAIESHSSHPIAKAIVKSCGISDFKADLSDIKECAGGGISAKFKGEVVALGNAKFIQSFTKCAPESLESEKCEIFLSLKNELIGAIILEDSLKDDAKEMVESLHKEGISLCMLSGDKSGVTEAVAKSLGITHYFGDLLPKDKLEHIEQCLKDCEKSGKKVAFVGDGINDAPTLARSDIGIAMGRKGSDIALDGADIVILNDEIKKIPQMLQLAKKTRSILWQNIIFAIGVKVAIMVFGAMGMTNLWVALFGDVGVAFLALLNATRAMR